MQYTFAPYRRSEIMTHHLNMGDSDPSGRRIDVTSLYFTRDERPWIGIMGEYHFTRDKRENWERELAKMKAGGITIVATYLFWIYHEEEEGVFEFSGDRDLRYFLECARQVGLDVLLRLGPWGHGEVRNGAFPDWLLKKKIPLRCNDPDYLHYAEIWYREIGRQIRGFLYREGGPVIGVQLENELVNDADHLLALKQLAVDAGIVVPLYTVTGWNSRYGARIPVDDVVPTFAAYVESPWLNTLEPLPLSPHYAFDTRRNDSVVGTDVIDQTDEDGWRLPYERYPFATCELGAGLQSNHHRRIVCSGMDAYAMSLVKLGCGNNLPGYYMYHGGINKIGKYSTLNESRATGYAKDCPILNYDYHTALSSYGETRPQYGLLNLLHLFVQDFGEGLARMEHVTAEQAVSQNDLQALRYCMRTDGESGYVFINNYQRLAMLPEHKHVIINTGDVVFPPICVKSSVSFFLPFNMKLSGTDLLWATVQPLCRVGQTWFFAAIPGITPQYCFADGTVQRPMETTGYFHAPGGTGIVTLSWKQAVHARKLDGQLYIGQACDVYMFQGELKTVQAGRFLVWHWTGDGFETLSIGTPAKQATLRMEPVEEPFVPPYLEELNIGCTHTRKWKRLSVNGPDGFVEIPDVCDAAQIYADGELVADQFYMGEPWRLPAELLFGRTCYLVTTDQKGDCYLEYEHFPEVLTPASPQELVDDI